MNYYEKYIKYKSKYLLLKGGNTMKIKNYNENYDFIFAYDKNNEKIVQLQNGLTVSNILTQDKFSNISLDGNEYRILSKNIKNQKINKC